MCEWYLIVVLTICILFAFTSCKKKDTSKSDNKNDANNTATESPTEIIDIDLSDDSDTANDSNTEAPTESTTTMVRQIQDTEYYHKMDWWNYLRQIQILIGVNL